MKKVVLLFCIHILLTNLYAQEPPCTPDGISTDPNNPVNPIDPDFVNYFDWTAYMYAVDEEWEDSGELINPNEHHNAGVLNLFGKKDYYPEDGWELVYVDLGLNRFGDQWDNRSGQMFFILYNKFRSILRVFVGLDVAPANLIEIELHQPDAGYQTALFAAMDKVQQPLRQFDPTIMASSAQSFTNNGSAKLWHYADFPVNYDPCTCLQAKDAVTGEPLPTESYLEINVSAVVESEINLEGTSDGSINPIVNQPHGTNTPGSAGWNEFYGNGKKVGNAIRAGNKAFKTYQSFIVDAHESAKDKEKENDIESGFNSLAKVMTGEIKALRHLPYASEAFAIIDFFIGGGKKDAEDNEIKIPPLAMQLEHRFKGNISTGYPYIRKDFYTPGSNFNVKNVQDPHGDPQYPIYNEILGVYTLLEKPRVTMWKGYAKSFTEAYIEDDRILDYVATNRIRRRAFQIERNSIKLAVNEASGLTLKEAYVQLNYFTRDSANWVSNPSGIVVNDSSWVSRMLPLECVGDYLVVSDINERYFHPYNGDDEDVVYEWETIDDLMTDISLILVFENADGDVFLHKSRWASDVTTIDYPYDTDYEINTYEDYYAGDDPLPVKIVRVKDWFNKPEFANLQRGFFNTVDNVNFNNTTLEEDTAAAVSIVIENSTIEAATPPPVNDGYTNLLAGKNIEVLPDSEILSNSDLQVSRLGVNCNAPITVATASEIASVCEGENYQGQKILAKKAALTELSIEPEEFSFITFPNPAGEYVKISLSENASPVDEIEVTVQDMTGRIVLAGKKLTQNEGLFELGTTNLKAGVYLLVVRTGTSSAVRKIIIQ